MPLEALTVFARCPAGSWAQAKLPSHQSFHVTDGSNEITIRLQ